MSVNALQEDASPKAGEERTPLTSDHCGYPDAANLITQSCKLFWNAETDRADNKRGGNILYTATNPKADLLIKGDVESLRGSSNDLPSLAFLKKS